jgi:hypothetical protein
MVRLESAFPSGRFVIVTGGVNTNDAKREERKCSTDRKMQHNAAIAASAPQDVSYPMLLPQLQVRSSQAEKPHLNT